MAVLLQQNSAAFNPNIQVSGCDERHLTVPAYRSIESPNTQTITELDDKKRQGAFVPNANGDRVVYYVTGLKTPPVEAARVNIAPMFRMRGAP